MALARLLTIGVVLILSRWPMSELVSADEPKPPGSTTVRANPLLPALTKIEDFAPPEEFVQAGGVKTHFVRKGEKGRTIVFIHGFGSSTHTWNRNLGPLSESYRVYAIDVKGFGLTAKPKDGQYHPAAWTQHLIDTLDALKIERPILVGNSMGGAIIARVALLRPERVAGIVLVDAAPPNWGPPRALGKSPETSAVMKPSGLPSLGDRFKTALVRSMISRSAIESGLKGAFHNPSLVTPEMIEASYIPLTIEGAAEALIAMTNPPKEVGPPLPSLKELKPPALIVWGRFDRVLPVRLIEDFARDLPKAKKVIFENSGHLPHEEESKAFNKLVAEFAASVP